MSNPGRSGMVSPRAEGLSPRSDMLPQEAGELVGADRLAEVEALHRVAGVVGEEGLLLLRLDAFGHAGHAQGLAHGDDRLGDRPVLGGLLAFAVEGAVALERVDRVALDLRERRVAHTEIGDGDA